LAVVAVRLAGCTWRITSSLERRRLVHFSPAAVATTLS
jgi:hypothetical protein